MKIISLNFLIFRYRHQFTLKRTLRTMKNFLFKKSSDYKLVAVTVNAANICDKILCIFRLSFSLSSVFLLDLKIQMNRISNIFALAKHAFGSNGTV